MERQVTSISPGHVDLQRVGTEAFLSAGAQNGGAA